MSEKKCMMCDEPSDDLTWVELRTDKGKVVPVIIDEAWHDKVLMCPDCVIQFFNWFGVDL